MEDDLVLRKMVINRVLFLDERHLKEKNQVVDCHQTNSNNKKEGRME